MPSEPAWLLEGLAAVMLVVSAYCAARLVLVRRLRRTLDYDVNGAHVVMGVAMAGMLVPALNLLPDAAWEALFCGLAAWFAWRSVAFVARRGIWGRAGDHIHGVSHYLTHLVMACGMLYMYSAAAPAPAGAAGSEMSMGPTPGTADFVALPLAFVAVLAVSAVWHLDALNRFATVRVAAAPRGAAGAAVVAAGGAATAVITATNGGSTGDPGAGQWLSPRLEMGCHIAMCVAMAFMLVLVL
jgi:hypothetical protein